MKFLLIISILLTYKISIADTIENWQIYKNNKLCASGTIVHLEYKLYETIPLDYTSVDDTFQIHYHYCYGIFLKRQITFSDITGNIIYEQKIDSSFDFSAMIIPLENIFLSKKLKPGNTIYIKYYDDHLHKDGIILVKLIIGELKKENQSTELGKSG